MRLISVKAFACLAVVLSVSGLSLRGQSAPAPVIDSDAAITRLYALAADYGAKLPSLSCHESISIFDRKHGEFKRTTGIESTIRVVRTGNDKSPFTETHTFLTKDGLPVPGKFNISYWVTGGFANALGLLHPELRGCNDFKVSTRDDGSGMQIDIAEKPQAKWIPACQEFSLLGFRKTLILDEAGHVLHLDRSVPTDVAKAHKEVSFAAMDYAPVKLGDDTLWLPSRLQSHDPKDDHRLEVQYSGCQRFTGSIKILDGVTPVKE